MKLWIKAFTTTATVDSPHVRVQLVDMSPTAEESRIALFGSARQAQISSFIYLPIAERRNGEKFARNSCRHDESPNLRRLPLLPGTKNSAHRRRQYSRH